ncbi:hypothetical protein ACWCQL_26915 [Streptomyces sp. NPDC002073]
MANKRSGRLKRWLPEQRLALWMVAGVAGIALTVLLAIELSPGPKPDTLPFELRRVCLQVLGVTVLGFVVAWATFRLQQAHLEQQRHADRIRAFLTEMLDAYHGVKQARRMLKAESAPETAPSIMAEAYSRLLSDLSKHQLVFETLARSAPLIERHVNNGCEVSVEEAGDQSEYGRASVTQSLTGHFEEIEHYLNGVVTEFEMYNRLALSDGRILLSGPSLERTIRFLYEKDEFKAKVSHRITAMVEALETTLSPAAPCSRVGAEPSVTSGVPSPRYHCADILEETTRPGRRLLILAVGCETYFLRRLDQEPSGEPAKPRESTWAFTECESATRLASRR